MAPLPTSWQQDGQLQRGFIFQRLLKVDEKRVGVSALV